MRCFVIRTLQILSNTVVVWIIFEIIFKKIFIAENFVFLWSYKFVLVTSKYREIFDLNMPRVFADTHVLIIKKTYLV